MQRVIAAPDRKTAIQIGQSMLGEEVYGEEYLDKLLLIQMTDDPLNISSWNPKYTWQWVLKNLGYSENGIEWIFSAGQKVGLKIK